MIVADFGGNFELARSLLKQRHYMPMLSRSRNRRLHRVRSKFLCLFGLLAEQWKALNTSSIDPVAVCDLSHRTQQAVW